MANLEHWLLASDTPSLRYFTLRYLLDAPETSAEVSRERQAIVTTGPVADILAAQDSQGHWHDPDRFYGPKYIGTHWTLLLLTELGVPEDEPRFQRGVSYLLDVITPFMQRNVAEQAHGWSCLWGNVLRYSAHAGLASDPRVTPIRERVVEELLGDSVCRSNGELACSWGVARSLYGLAALPVSLRSPSVQTAIDQGLDFLLNRYHLHEGNYPTSGRIHKLWSHLSFPLFYQVDILFVLRLLAELKALDRPDAQASLEWLIGQRDQQGRWHGNSPYRQRTRKIEAKREETSRWVSLHAAMVLREAGQQVLAG